MSPNDWRALIEAYLDGRISAEAFARRFVDGWNTGAAAPRAIADLHPAVEAFEADMIEAGEEGRVDDDDLRQAASRALSNLSEEGAAPSAHTFDRVRAREEMLRFQVNAKRILGLGCLIVIAWIALCVLQIYFVSEFIQQATDWGAWPSALIGFFLAFVPVIGNVLAFAGATQEGWPVWLAALVFFAAPALTILSGWSRWRRAR
jgi:hypothetical protein